MAKTTTIKKGTKTSARPHAKSPAGLHDKLVWYALATLMVVVAVTYANGLSGEFVFDDQNLIVMRRWPQDFQEAVRMFRYGYRPVREFSYALDISIWGQNPFGFHLTNLLIHAANVLMIFFLGRKLMNRLLPATAAALIFAVHPIQTDSVTYISGRRDVLYAFFYVAAFHLYLKWRETRRKRNLAAFLFCWGLSLLSKEMAVSLPLVIFAWSFVELWPRQEGSWLRCTLVSIVKSLNREKWLYAPLLAAMLGYTWYYVFVKHASTRVGSEGIEYWGGSFYSNLLMAVRAQAWYLKQLVFPTPIAQYFDAFQPSSSVLEWRVLVAIGVVAAVIVAGFVLLKKNRVMAFAVFSYFAMLLPVSQIIPHHEFVADHYLYLPLASFGLFVAAAVEALITRYPAALRPAYAALGVIILILAVMTVLTNRRWGDALSLWQANYEAVPRSARAASNLAGEYLRRRGDVQKAEFYYKQALASDPKFEPAYTALVSLYLSLKRYDRAEETIHQGLEVAQAGGGSFITIRKPQLFRAQLKSSLGAVKRAEGDNAAAEQLLREAIGLQPDYLEPYAVLANIYHDTDPSKEIEVLQTVLRIRSDYYELHVRVFSLLIQNKRYDESVVYANRALALIPNENDCQKASGYLDTARRFSGAASGNAAVMNALQRLSAQCAK
jgi:tetratricopeptide (TPR) repeat protein